MWSVAGRTLAEVNCGAKHGHRLVVCISVAVLRITPCRRAGLRHAWKVVNATVIYVISWLIGLVFAVYIGVSAEPQNSSSRDQGTKRLRGCMVGRLGAAPCVYVFLAFVFDMSAMRY